MPGCYRVIVADPPWAFDDQLDGMKADTPRAAAANYPVLDLEALKALPVRELAEPDAVLGLWTPASMLREGLDVMAAWGFRQTQEWTWVKLTSTEKTAEDGFGVLPDGTVAVHQQVLLRTLAGLARRADRIQRSEHNEAIVTIPLPLAFGMGRLARAAKETMLVGVRGQLYRHVRDKGIRDVFFAPAGKHSEKPECVQDALDRMVPEGKALELFARRQRDSFPDPVDRWTCIGNEAPATLGEDIRDSVQRLLRPTPCPPADAALAPALETLHGEPDAVEPGGRSA